MLCAVTGAGGAVECGGCGEGERYSVSCRGEREVSGGWSGEWGRRERGDGGGQKRTSLTTVAKLGILEGGAPGVARMDWRCASTSWLERAADCDSRIWCGGFSSMVLEVGAGCGPSWLCFCLLGARGVGWRESGDFGSGGLRMDGEWRRCSVEIVGGEKAGCANEI